MDKRTFQTRQNEIWPSIVSVIVPLIQLLLIASASLSGILNLQKFFFNPETLNLVNVLTLFTTLSLIGWFWYWRNHSFFFFQPQDIKEEKRRFIPPEKRVFSLIRILFILSSLFFSIFVITVILFLMKKFIFSEILLAVIQYLSYCFFLTFTGLILYIWISEYIRKKQTFKREDFIRNLLNTLNAHGLISTPDVKIWKSQIAQGWSAKIVELEVDQQRYTVVASFDGLEVQEIYKTEEYEALIEQ